MKGFILRPFIALTILIVVFSGATFAHLARKSLSRRDGALVAQTKKQSDPKLSPWQTLLSFENQDLTKLDDQSGDKLQKAIDGILGGAQTGPFGQPYRALSFSKISDFDRQVRYTLIEKSGSFKGPPSYIIRVHVFTLEGKLVNSSAFSPGRRTIPTEIEVTHLLEIGREGIVISTRSTQWATDQGKQYYALIRQRLSLVRREDSRGELIRNGYSDSPIGPEVAGRSAEEWQMALESNDAAEVLAALTWLAAIPLNHSQFDSGEKTAEARLADDVRSRERVKVTLKKLSQSANVWIRDATELAAKAWRPTERKV